MAETRDRSRANGDQRVRCLMWVPGGYDAPLELLEGLRQRGTLVREVRDAPGVMAELGKRGPSFAKATEGRAQVVVIVEPGVLRDAERLIAAVQRYHPDVKLWKYEFRNGVALGPIQRKTGVVDPNEVNFPARRGKPEGGAERSINDKVPITNDKISSKDQGSKQKGDEASRWQDAPRTGAPSPGPPRRIFDLEAEATLSRGERGLDAKPQAAEAEARTPAPPRRISDLSRGERGLDAKPQAAMEEAAREEETPVVLTAEELAMLLGDGEEQ